MMPCPTVDHATTLISLWNFQGVQNQRFIGCHLLSNFIRVILERLFQEILITSSIMKQLHRFLSKKIMMKETHSQSDFIDKKKKKSS